MRARIVSCLALVVLSAFPYAGAEVSARLNEDGQYIGMIYRYNAGFNRRVWNGPAATNTRRPLNLTGDQLGDLVPTVLENPVLNNWPTVVWSHPNGGDYDLVFSRWTGTAWSPITFVQNDNFYNDLDPRLAFTSTGRPYMVWWTDYAGSGVVSFSMYLESRWMAPIVVSTAGQDSRHPSLILESDSLVSVTYETAEGSITRTISITTPGDTITDDIEPQIRRDMHIQ